MCTTIRARKNTCLHIKAMTCNSTCSSLHSFTTIQNGPHLHRGSRYRSGLEIFRCRRWPSKGNFAWRIRPSILFGWFLVAGWMVVHMIFEPAAVFVNLVTLLARERTTYVQVADGLLSVRSPLAAFSALQEGRMIRHALCNLSCVLASHQLSLATRIYRAILDQQLDGSRCNTAAYNFLGWWWAWKAGWRRIIMVLSKHALACQQVDSLIV